MADPTYQEIAQAHWEKYRPQAWAAMKPAQRRRFLDGLAEQVENAKADAVRREATAPLDPAESSLEKMQRIETARVRAEHEAMREFLLPTPEGQETAEQTVAEAEARDL